MPLRDYLRGGKPRSDRDASHATAKVIGLLVVLVGFVAFLFIGHFKGQAGLVRADPTTLCPTNCPPSEVVVVLLDMSDEFTEPQRLKIRNELERIIASVARLGLVEVYAVDRLEERVTKPVVHLCNPGTGADLNRIYQNPELARRRWEGFVRQLETELDRLMDTPASSTSAIFEAVQATALRTFNRPGYDQLSKRLVIVSDLLQNVPGKLNQYHQIQSFDEFKNSGYFSEVRADLSGVTVSLLYLVRPRAPQKWPEHYQFWEQYFRSQKATVERVEPVYGAQ